MAEIIRMLDYFKYGTLIANCFNNRAKFFKIEGIGSKSILVLMISSKLVYEFSIVSYNVLSSSSIMVFNEDLVLDLEDGFPLAVLLPAGGEKDELGLGGKAFIHRR